MSTAFKSAPIPSTDVDSIAGLADRLRRVFATGRTRPIEWRKAQLVQIKQMVSENKDEFIEACRQYTGWVWPIDRVDKFKNQPWSQITERDQRMLQKKGFESSIQKNPRLLKAGWLKTTGKGGGGQAISR